MKFFLIRVLENCVLRLSVIFSTLVARAVFWFYGCKVGQRLSVDGKCVVQCRRVGAIRMGDDVKINSRFRSNLVGMCQPTVLCVYDNGSIEIGDKVGISGAVISSRDKITIGNHATLGGNVRIFDHDFHSLDAEHRRVGKTDRENIKSAPITIEEDVFIGTNAIILKGVHIGARSVIGAGAVVALRKIPADSVVVGSPARIIKSG
jgi:acetyltransferase-like isoleucine patch superfamily enzyme